MTPPSHPITIPYRPERKGIQVIQKYVTTVSEKDGCRQPSTRKGDILNYDFVGAVGLKKGRSRKATVVYHVYWTGFGPDDMTWEPERNLFKGDLEVLWSKYGRVNSAGEICWIRGANDMQLQPDLSDFGVFQVGHTKVVNHIKPQISVDDTDGSQEKDLNQTSLPDSGASRAPEELESCTTTMQSHPERDIVTLHKIRSFFNPTSSQITDEPSSSALTSLQPNKMEIDFSDEIRQSDTLNMPDLCETGSRTLSDPPSQTTRDPEKDLAIDVIDSCSIQHGSGIVHNESKRKRRFYHRTRTGCLSCRERKKKCDEQRPSCESCGYNLHWRQSDISTW